VRRTADHPWLTTQQHWNDMKLRAILAALAILGATQQTASAQAPKDRVVIALPAEPPGLDPAMQPAAAVSEVVWENIFEGLTRFDPAGKIVPGLAESWSHDSPTRYVFKLRAGVKFHDGKPMTSEDVKFSFERNAAPESTNKRKRVFANFAGIDTPDPLTVAINLKEPSALLPFFLAEGTASIQSAATAASNRTAPVGTGPYKFVRWVRGDSIEMEQFADYNGAPKSRIPRVVFRFMPDENSQVLALRAGQVDYLPYIAAVEAIDSLKKEGNFRITQGQTQGVLFLGMNNKKPPFDDVRVRRAMYAAIDAQMVNDGTHGGFGKKGGAQTNELNPYFVDVLGTPKYDLKAARKMLADAGHPNGFSVNLRVLSNPSTRRTAEILAAQLSEVGIQVKLEVLETAQWLDIVFKNKNYDMTIISHPEPWAILNYTDPNYFYQYDSEKFRALMKQAEASTDEASLRRNLAAAQRQLYEDAPVVWLYAMPQVGVVREGLTGTRTGLPVPAYPVAEMSWSK
jgi:peptide/nickel transport system substrate-binding protein